MQSSTQQPDDKVLLKHQQNNLLYFPNRFDLTQDTWYQSEPEESDFIFIELDITTSKWSNKEKQESENTKQY